MARVSVAIIGVSVEVEDEKATLQEVARITKKQLQNALVLEKLRREPNGASGAGFQTHVADARSDNPHVMPTVSPEVRTNAK